MSAVKRTPDTSRGSYLRTRPPVGRRVRRSVLLLGAAAVVALLGVALTGENGLRTYLGLRSERIRFEEDVARLQDHHDELATGLAALDEKTGDPEALERVARERYRMHRPDETVIEVVGEDELPVSAIVER